MDLGEKDVGFGFGAVRVEEFKGVGLLGLGVQCLGFNGFRV